MKIFVTGASGFLGRRLIERLVREKHKVTAHARSKSSAVELLKNKKIKVVTGAFEDMSSWEKNLKGNDAVIHCAAPVEFWGEWEKFEKDIVVATRNLLESTERMGIKKFIYISSESVLQSDFESLIGADESYPYPVEPNSFYGKAKMLAEKEISGRKSKLQCIIIRPTFIWGKGVKAVDSIAEKVNSGQFSWVDGGECVMDMVHVENVVEAILLACKKGKKSALYFVTDDSAMKVKDFISMLLQTKGIKLPKKNIPSFIAKVLAKTVESAWKLLRIKKSPPISRFELSFVAQPRKYNISRIRKDLGYKPVMILEKGLAEMKNH